MSIAAYAIQLGIPINRRFPMTLTGGASLERLGQLIRYPLSHGESVDLNYLVTLNHNPLRNRHSVVFFLAVMYLLYEI